MKRFLIKLHWFMTSQLGLNPYLFLRSIGRITYFLRDWWKFRQNYTGELVWRPCLHDLYEEGGTTKSEYFWQDLLVARWIYDAKPLKHVDIGSRIDGFVAHVASFREIEVFDVRPISTQIPGVIFKQADVMQLLVESKSTSGYCDSLSCLHALEHFGLGRYGDPIDPQGFEKGFVNMAALLKPGGVFYLSVPIGYQRVEFNAHRVFDPRIIIQIANSSGFELQGLIVVVGGDFKEVEPVADNLRRLAETSYNLGIFTFLKMATNNESGYV